MAQKHAGRQKLFGHWHTVPTWARDLARVGYSAKAIVYLLIGGVALCEAIRRQGAQSSPSHTMHLLRLQPLGFVGLGVLAAGMCCYGLHRCIEAAVGPVRTRFRMVELLHRIGRLSGGLTYLGFASLAISFIVHDRSDDSGGPLLAGRVMTFPFGNSAVAIMGAIVAAVGVMYFYDVLSGRYSRSYNLRPPARSLRCAIAVAAIYGIISRGLFFLLCGALIIYSGLTSNPSSARGMKGVLSIIQKLPLGQWLFGVIAAGFVSYGLFCVVRASYGTYPSDVGV